MLGEAGIETPFARASPFALQHLDAAQGGDPAGGWIPSGGGASPPSSMCMDRAGSWAGGGGAVYGSPQRRRSSPAPANAGNYGGDPWAAQRAANGVLCGDDSMLELRREILHARRVQLLTPRLEVPLKQLPGSGSRNSMYEACTGSALSESLIEHVKLTISGFVV